MIFFCEHALFIYNNNNNNNNIAFLSQASWGRLEMKPTRTRIRETQKQAQDKR